MARLSRHYTATLDDLPERILSEFQAQPGLGLTFPQACRLWNVPEPDCGDALDYLVRCGLLRRTPNGQYCLALAPGRLAHVPGGERRARCV
jgi:DNA-binding IclR family transcriptional regulator